MTSPRLLCLAVASCLCLALTGCKHGDGNGPPGAGGPPPGQGAPGAPVAPGGNGGGGNGGGGHGAPGAPYQIPGTVLLDASTTLDDQNWAEILPLFWANCPGHGHCVRPVREFRPKPGGIPCGFVEVEPAARTWVAYGTVITVVGVAPCSTSDGGGSSPGDSPPVSPGDSPDDSGQSAPPASP